MSKGKRIRAKIHRSLREARDKDLAKEKRIDFAIRLANLKPEDFDGKVDDDLVWTKKGIDTYDEWYWNRMTK